MQARLLVAGAAVAVLSGVAAWPADRETPSTRQAEEKLRLRQEGQAAERKAGAVLFDHAEALERRGKGPEAVIAYRGVARNGSGRAAKRLGEIYAIGIPGVPPDLVSSRRWFYEAHELGEQVPLDAGALAAERAARQRADEEAARDRYLRREPYRGGPPGDEALRKTR